MKGTVARMKPESNYGYIYEKGRDYFFHRDDFVGHWNDLVLDYHNNLTIQLEFEPDKTPRGYRARQVRRLDWPNES